MNDYWAGLLAAAIGATVGAGEIVSRYKDAPNKALVTLPGALYVLSNALAAVAALGFMVAFNWPATSEGTWWTRAFAAGFGAVAFFRTSLFSVRMGDQDVPIGPSTVLQVMTRALDQAVDRERARNRATAVREIMSEISYEASGAALPS